MGNLYPYWDTASNVAEQQQEINMSMVHVASPS